MFGEMPNLMTEKEADRQIETFKRFLSNYEGWKEIQSFLKDFVLHYKINIHNATKYMNKKYMCETYTENTLEKRVKILNDFVNYSINKVIDIYSYDAN